MAAVLMALSAAACTTNGQSGPTAATPRGPTVAFESIDGPPESVFHRLVQTMSEEAEVRQVAVVSRTGPAQYRVRGYLAAQTQANRSTISWVWDVYDADQRRTLRIIGEEPASTAGSGTWAAADDQMLRRMARSGMDRLVAFLASPAATAPREPAGTPAAPPSGDEMRGEAIAANDDFAPEAAGIFRTAAAAPAAQDNAAAAVAPGTTPIPRRRPPGSQSQAPAAVAYLNSAH